MAASIGYSWTDCGKLRAIMSEMPELALETRAVAETKIAQTWVELSALRASALSEARPRPGGLTGRACVADRHSPFLAPTNRGCWRRSGHSNRNCHRLAIPRCSADG